MSAARSLLRPLLPAALWALGACTPSPQPIAYGRDACDYCRMVISDPRYGAELVTSKGKVHTFDSIECLAAYYLQAREGGAVHSVWVSDYAHPGTLVPAAEARFVRAAGPASPMGMGLTAFAADAEDAALRRSSGGAPPLRWEEVLALVEREGMPHGAAAHRAPPRSPDGGERDGAR